MIRLLWVSMTAAALLLGGCSHVISEKGRLSVTAEVHQAQIWQDPDEHQGAVILLGAQIVSVEQDRGKTTLELSPYRVDRWGQPYAVVEETGNILATTDTLLDPALFSEGVFITFTAEVLGTRVRETEQEIRPYPLLRIEELYLWEDPFRWGLYPHPNIYAPYYLGPEPPGRTSPYDPGREPAGKTPYWYRF